MYNRILIMNYSTINNTEAEAAKSQLQWFIDNKKAIRLEEVKATRSNLQNAARWKYLSDISEMLNERGQTFTPPGLKIDVPFTKDNLYANYWQALRGNMYPGKTKQLNTKEFSDLVEMAVMMFATVFSISIPFPNYKTLLDKQNAEIH